MKHIRSWSGIWSLLLTLCLLSACTDKEPVVTASPHASASLPALPVMHHRLHVTPDTNLGLLSVRDEVRFSNTSIKMPEFTLAATFSVKPSPGIIPLAGGERGSQRYRSTGSAFTLEYSGKLHSTPDCAWLTQPCVMFDQNGIFLDANSGWYAQADGVLHTFELDVSLPEGWSSLSQGQETAGNKGWSENQPQQGIYLLAGPYSVYRQQGEYGTAMVYLRSADEDLARRYLQATHQYLGEYSHLLGDYPYAKFATVESFWETGWGMPSFTLLGSRVMRLPFILHSSFPHEILHNWWGNSVYVDAAAGNWSEGLTAYQADFRLREANGEGMPYRRDILQKYATFVADGQGSPALQDFRSRHDQASQAVGYGKAMMLFHALRQQLGGDVFLAGLRQFWLDFRFRPASFRDLQHSLEVVSGQDLQAFFTQWLTRTDAPVLHITKAALQQEEGGYVVDLGLRQSGVQPAFHLRVPVQTGFADGHRQTHWLEMTQAEQDFRLELDLEQAPTELAVDPGFDVFRMPDAGEVPPALDVLFSRQPRTFVLSRQVPAGMEIAWEELVDALSYGQDNMHRQYDDEPLPDDGVVVLLGGDNAALAGLLDRASQPFKLSETAYTLNSVNYTCGLHSLALSLRAGGQQLLLLDASTPLALQTLADKLPHYGKYSYVLFNSATGENVAKGQWDVTDSPLLVHFAASPEAVEQ